MTTYKLLTDNSASKALLSNTNIYNWETRTDAEVDTENPENRNDDTIKQNTGYVDTLATSIGLISNIMGFTRKEAATENTFHAFPITFVNNTKSVIMTSIAATSDTDNTVISDRPGVILPKAQADVVIESALDTDGDGESTNSTSIWFDIWGVKTDTSLTTSGEIDWGWRIEIERSAYSTEHARSTLRVTKVTRLRNDGTITTAEADGQYVYDASTGQFNIFGADEPEESGLPLVAFSCPEYMSEHNRGEFVITLLEHSIPLSVSEQPPEFEIPDITDKMVNPAADPSKTETIVLTNGGTGSLPYGMLLENGGFQQGGVLSPTESVTLSVVNDGGTEYSVYYNGKRLRELYFNDSISEDKLVFPPFSEVIPSMVEYNPGGGPNLPAIALAIGQCYVPMTDENGISGDMVNNNVVMWYLEENVATIVITDKTPPNAQIV